MADTDPKDPLRDEHDDDAIGFASPRSLQPAPPPSLPGEAAPPAAFPHVSEPTPRPTEPAQAFPSAQTFEPQPRPEPAPDAFAGATRPFQRVVAGADAGLTQLGGERVALAGYVCLIGSILSGGALIVLTLVMAQLSRRSAEGWVRSHLDYQRTSALTGTLGVIAGLVTLPVGFGVFILTLAIVWMAIRGVAGLQKYLRREPLRAVRFWSLP